MVFQPVSQIYKLSKARVWAWIAQSVSRLATDWTIRGSNLGEFEIFSVRPDRSWFAPSLLKDGFLVSSGAKRPGRGVDYQLPSSAEVKERVELHLYPTPRAFVASYMMNLTFTDLHCTLNAYLHISYKVALLLKCMSAYCLQTCIIT
jgi:hypothetical protein